MTGGASQPRRALVTGGGRGLGAAIVARLRTAGVEVIAPDRATCDLASIAAVEAYLARIADTTIDVLVNNAAENFPRPLADISIDQWQRTLTINLTAPFLLTQYVAPRMASRGWGRIVNISSVYSMLARPGRVVYSCSKAALNALTRITAVEYSGANVLVNAVCPGFVDTELTRQNNTPDQIRGLVSAIPAGRLATPAEIAEVVSFLCSDQNTYVTGQSILADGAFSIV